MCQSPQRQHVIPRAAIPKDENWPSLKPTINGGDDLGQPPTDAEPKAPTPDWTILEQIDLSGC